MADFFSKLFLVTAQ